MQEYAVHADYEHIREFADADENLNHIRDATPKKTGSMRIGKYMRMAIPSLDTPQKLWRHLWTDPHLLEII